MGTEKEQIAVSLGHATGERRLLGGGWGCFMGPSASWFYQGAGFEVGAHYLGWEREGCHVSLAVCCAAPSQGPSQ